MRGGGLDRDRPGRAPGVRDRRDHPARGLDEPPAGRGGRRGQRAAAVTWSRRRGSGIPAIIHEETLHGLLAWAAPCFQQSIGVAATFDPDLAGRAAATLRRRMLATGARHALAPVLDLGTRPALGADRGDLRRGPVPRVGDGRRLHPRPPGRHRWPRASWRPAKHLVAPRDVRGRPQPGARPPRLAPAARRAAGRRSRPRSARRASAASCPPTARSTACPATRRGS